MPGTLKSWSAMRAQYRILLAKRPRLKRALSRLKSILPHEEGVTAIEFALLSPLLVGAVLLIGLFGLQINHYIKLDQILRAGAALAITDPGDTVVLERMRAVALEKGYTLRSKAGPDALVLQSVRGCFCPGINGALGCDQICPGQRPTVVRYTLDAFHSQNSLVDALFMRLAKIGFGPVFYDPFVSTQVTVR